MTSARSARSATSTWATTEQFHVADESLPYAEVASVIRDSALIGLACHVNPDPDALGSLLAMHHALVAIGKSVVSSFPAPFALSAALSWMPGTDEITDPRDFPDRVDVLVTFDAADLQRLHEFAHHGHMAGTLVVIDHHLTNPGFGDINLIDPKAASTGNVVAALLPHIGATISPDVATCLYAALAADTGSFRFRTGSDTLKYASALVEHGADPQAAADKLWGTMPLAALRLLGDVLTRAVCDSSLSLLSSTVTNGDLASHGVGRGEIEEYVEILARAAEADVACLCRELSDGRVKASLRGRGQVDLGSLAAEVGGGGHHDAAGFTALTFDEAIGHVRRALAIYETHGASADDR